MGISIDITANAKSFVDAAGQAGASLSEITDALKFIQENADISDANLQKLFADTIAKAEAAGDASQQAYNRGTASVREMTSALQQQERQLAETQSQYERLAGTPAVLDETLAKNGQAAEESGEKIQESGKLGEAALMNLGFSSMQAGSLFKDGISGMAEQAGTFAAFLGPSLAAADGALASFAWPVTIAGVALAALSGIMQTTGADEAELQKQTQDLLNSFLGTAAGGDELDQGLRAWAKSADDFGGISLTDLQKKAKDTGLSFGQIASAIATQSLPSMREQRDAIQEQITKLTEWDARENATVGAAHKTVDANREKIQTLNQVKSALDTNIQANQLSVEAEKALAEQNHMTVDQYKAYEAAMDAAKTAQKSFTDSLHSNLQQAGQDTSDFTVNGVLDIQKYIDHLNGITTSIIQESQNLTSVAPYLTQAGLTYVESLGAQAAPLLAKAASLSPTDPEFQQLMQAWDDAGNASGKQFGDGVQSGMPGSVNGPSVKITADDYAYQQVIQRIKNNPPTITLPVRAAPLLGGYQWY